MAQFLFDAAWIAARIPHAGSMSLLDGVLEWSEATIHCRASSHRDAAHPLRRGGHLGICNGIEYAAQAMAVHGALLAGRGDAPRLGFLTSVRDIALHVPTLDVESDLEIFVEQLSGEGMVKLYSFRIEAAGKLLINGRVTVMPDAGDGES